MRTRASGISAFLRLDPTDARTVSDRGARPRMCRPRSASNREDPSNRTDQHPRGGAAAQYSAENEVAPAVTRISSITGAPRTEKDAERTRRLERTIERECNLAAELAPGIDHRATAACTRGGSAGAARGTGPRPPAGSERRPSVRGFGPARTSASPVSVTRVRASCGKASGSLLAAGDHPAGSPRPSSRCRSPRVLSRAGRGS